MKFALISQAFVVKCYKVTNGKAYTLDGQPYSYSHSIGNDFFMGFWNYPFLFDGYYLNISNLHIIYENLDIIIFANDNIKQVRKMDPSKDTITTFAYQNLSKAADDAYGLKTFSQTLAKDLPGGKKEIKVIGKGSKIFRELFGEIEDARHSIFEGMNKLSVIARKNQLFDEILDVDDAMKAAAKSDTPLGQRGFFHGSPVIAKRAFGPEADIVPMDDYVK